MVDISIPSQGRQSHHFNGLVSNQNEFHLGTEGENFSKDNVKMGFQLTVNYHKTGTQFGQTDEIVAQGAQSSVRDLVSQTMAEEVYKAASEHQIRLTMETNLTSKIDSALKAHNIKVDDVEITGIKADDRYAMTRQILAFMKEHPEAVTVGKVEFSDDLNRRIDQKLQQ